MRYVRHLVAFVATLGAGGAAYAQAPEESGPPPTMDQQQQQPPMYQQQQPPTYQQQQQMEGQPPPPQCCVEEPAPPPQAYQPPPHRRRWTGNRVFAPSQIALSVGGGGADFIFDRMSHTVQTGAAWDARLVFGTRSFIAFEAGYAGTANRLESSGAQFTGGSHAYLVGNGFETNLRINLFPWYVEPYIFGGVGYNHFNIANRNNDPVAAAQFHDSDDAFLLPAGAGIAGYIGHHATLDARFTYRAIFSNNILVGAENVPDSRADQWTVLGRLGYQF
jgi:hypothetical protein